MDKKALDALIQSIDKKHGKGALITPQSDFVKDVDAISSGSISLDMALGIGGYAVGRIIEIYGQESSGKTTLAIHAMVEAQSKESEKYVGIIDAEHAFDLTYAKNLGLDADRFVISQPDCGEQGLDILTQSIRSGMFSLMVVDSVTAMQPKSVIDGEIGDANVGKHARLMSQSLGKITQAASNTGTTVIFINQMREKVGVMFGSPWTTTGGNALKFYASMRLEISRVGSVKEGDEIVGNSSKVKVAKNKLSSPFKVCEFDIRFGEGVDKIAEMLRIAEDAGVIKKSGSWFSYGDTRLSQGREATRAVLKDNPELCDEILEKIFLVIEKQ